MKQSTKYVLLGLALAALMVILIVAINLSHLPKAENRGDGIKIGEFGSNVWYGPNPGAYEEMTMEEYRQMSGREEGLPVNFELPEVLERAEHFVNLTKDESGNYTVLRDEGYRLKDENGQTDFLFVFSQKSFPQTDVAVSIMSAPFSEINGAILQIEGNGETYLAMIQEHRGFYFFVHGSLGSEEEFLDFLRTVTK